MFLVSDAGFHFVLLLSLVRWKQESKNKTFLMAGYD